MVGNRKRNDGPSPRNRPDPRVTRRKARNIRAIHRVAKAAARAHWYCRPEHEVRPYIGVISIPGDGRYRLEGYLPEEQLYVLRKIESF